MVYTSVKKTCFLLSNFTYYAILEIKQWICFKMNKPIVWNRYIIAMQQIVYKWQCYVYLQYRVLVLVSNFEM